MASPEQSVPAASGKRAISRAGRLPGLLPAGAVSLLCAVLSWAWLAGALGAARLPSDAAAQVSDLAQVGAEETSGALATLDQTPDIQARFAARRIGCNEPLAWAAISRAPGTPGGRIRLRSGDYVSPAFTLTDQPVRVALPFPAPTRPAMAPSPS